MTRTAEKCLQKFFGKIAEVSQHNDLTFAEFGVRPVSMPIEVFTLLVEEGLELGEEYIALCLIMMRKVVQKGLRVSRRCLYRLVTVCLILVGKLYEEEQLSMETFSLLSGIPISQLVVMESNLVDVLDFDLIISGDELSKFMSQQMQNGDASFMGGENDFNEDS